MINKETDTLITLLDDPDREVYEVVSQHLISKGEVAVPELEEAWETSENKLVQQRIEVILEEIQQNIAYKGLAAWIKKSDFELAEGAYWVSKLQYPGLNLLTMNRELDLLVNEIWLEINENLTALEKVRIINHFLYQERHFTSDRDFMAPQYCHLNHVLEIKKGNPISLGILYLIVAQRLSLPIHGVCVPRNFVLAYQDNYSSNILFYINAFYRGTPISEKDVQAYLKEMKITPKASYLKACDNLTCIHRLVETLVYANEKAGYEQKAEAYRNLLPLFGKNSTSLYEDDENQADEEDL